MMSDRVALLVQKLVLHGKQRRGRSGGDAQLVVDVLDMVMHRAVGHDVIASFASSTTRIGSATSSPRSRRGMPRPSQRS